MNYFKKKSFKIDVASFVQKTGTDDTCKQSWKIADVIFGICPIQIPSRISFINKFLVTQH